MGLGVIRLMRSSVLALLTGELLNKMAWWEPNYFIDVYPNLVCPVAWELKNLPAMQETQVRSLPQEDPLEKEMASHSSILASRITRTGDSGGLPFMGSQRVRHDWARNAYPNSCSYKLRGYLFLQTTFY